MHYHFKVTKEAKGFSAVCLELSGCITQANSRKSLRANMQNALGLYLNNLSDMKKPLPMLRNFSPKASIVAVQVSPNIATAIKLKNPKAFKFDKRFKNKFDKEMGPLSFAKVMRASRTSMDLTQEDFGKKLGLSRAKVSNIERGRQLGSAELAIKVAKKAGLSEKIALQACLQDQVRKSGFKAVVTIR